MENTKNDIIEKTLAFWQPRSRETLTREDAREMVENMAGFFSVLMEWERRANQSKNGEGK